MNFIIMVNNINGCTLASLNNHIRTSQNPIGLGLRKQYKIKSICTSLYKTLNYSNCILIILKPQCLHSWHWSPENPSAHLQINVFKLARHIPLLRHGFAGDRQGGPWYLPTLNPWSPRLVQDCPFTNSFWIPPIKPNAIPESRLVSV